MYTHAKLQNPFTCWIAEFVRKVVAVYYRSCDVDTEDFHMPLRGADAVFVALSLNDETRNMITEHEIEHMRGTYVINIA